MREAPTGRVTLIFTDVEGSTVLWERAPEAMRQGLLLHDELMRKLIAEYDGYEVKTEGDAFMVAFSETGAALRWCCAVQEGLLQLDWPEDLLVQPEAAKALTDGGGRFLGLRVRMGGHVGEPDCREDPLTGRMDYFGQMVNRAARVGASGHGGQVVLSSALIEASDVPDDVVVMSMGRHGLKGLSSPEELYQVLPKDLAGRSFPPLRTVTIRKTNLDADSRTFIGREEALAQLVAFIDDGERCVSIFGPGGMGKTRLVRHFANDWIERLPGGAWFCDLTAAKTAEAIVSRVAAVLGVPLPSGDGAFEVVGSALKERGKLLLVLDNFEQVVEVGAILVEGWLEQALELMVFVTTRELLTISAERVLSLEPLESLAGRKLFFERAREHGRVVGEEDEGHVDAIVGRLDGIPLAIELAAARAGMLSPSALREQLEKSFDVLRTRRRDIPARQATLRATVDWSWKLLGEGEGDILARCALFRGPFDVEAAAEVIGRPLYEVMDGLEALQDRAMLQRSLCGADPRFTMYETIRAFALERLNDDASAEIRERHCEYFTGRAEKLTAFELYEAARYGRNGRLFEIEGDDMLAAHEWALESDIVRAARLAVAMLPYLVERVAPVLRRHVFDETVKRARGQISDELFCHLLSRRSRLNRTLGAMKLAVEDATECLDLAESLDNRDVFVECLLSRGIANIHFHQMKEAEADLRQALSTSKEIGNSTYEALALAGLANVIMRQGDTDGARANFEAAVKHYREVNNHGAEAKILGSLGFIAWHEGREDDAHAFYQRAISLHEEVENRVGLSFSQINYAEMLAVLGDTEKALPLIKSSLKMNREMGMGYADYGPTLTLGVLELLKGNKDEALSLVKESLAKAIEVEERLWVSNIYYYLAIVHAQRDEIGAAEGCIAESRNWTSSEGGLTEEQIFSEAFIKMARVRLLRSKGNDEKAESLREEVYEFLVDFVCPDERPDSVDFEELTKQVHGYPRMLYQMLVSTWKDQGSKKL